MTSRRNLGPILAIGGASIAGAAVVAGFIAVGGPGDARNVRLDNILMRKIEALAAESQCAFSATGKSYETVAQLKGVADQIRRGDKSHDGSCGFINPDVQPSEIVVEAEISTPGQISYAATDKNEIRLCGMFRVPYDPNRRPTDMFGSMGEDFRQFSVARPAGKHCYQLELFPSDDGQNKAAPVESATESKTPT